MNLIILRQTAVSPPLPIAELLFELTLYLLTFQACGNKLMQHGCNSEEAVTGMKDNQLGRVLERIGSTLADWDSCKCPPMKAHIDRMKTKEGAAVTGCSPSSAIGGKWLFEGPLLLPT